MNDFNVKEILNKYNIDYQENRGNNEIDILCPFHTDTNFGNASINEETGFFYCFSCQEGGNIYRFVALLEGIEEKDAYKLVNNNFDKGKTYSLIKLKSKNILPKENYISLSNKILFKILKSLITINDVDFSNRWLIICTYIKMYKTQLREKQLLLLFSEFNTEVKKYYG